MGVNEVDEGALMTDSEKVTVVQEGWGSGNVTCDRCGEKFHLYFNGGELDGHTCSCGRRWYQEALRYDLKMKEPAGKEARDE